jgi:F-type H+-transporting ATPase subunit delta
VDVSEPASISSNIAARYASAVFEISKEANALPALETDIEALSAAVSGSDDLRVLISSPLYSRDDQAKAIAAVAQKMDLGATLTNTLSLMASKRRLFVVPALVDQLRAMMADAKGEVAADVKSAQPLSEDQAAALAATLKSAIGKEIKLNVAVDESLIGGLVVKVGSKMIDTSIASKLANLQNAMKEAR